MQPDWKSTEENIEIIERALKVSPPSPPSLRRWPASEDAELHVIGGCLFDPDKMSDVNLPPSAFYVRDHQVIWRAMQEVAATGVTVDQPTVWSHLTARGVQAAESLSAIQDMIPSAAYVAGYAREVEKLAALRALIRTLSEQVELATSGVEDVRQFATRCRDAVDALIEDVTVGSDADFISAGGLWDASIAALQRRMTGEAPTGFQYRISTLDSVLDPMVPGQMVVVGARPSVGKTAFGLQVLGEVAAAGGRCLFFSLEQTAERIGDRMIAQWARVPLSCMVSGEGLDDREVDKILAARSRIESLDLKVIDIPRMSPAEIVARTRREIREHGSVDLVVVDHMHHVKSDTPGQSRYQEVSEISKALKASAKELQCAVMVLAQLSRKSVDGGKARPPAVSDLRDAGTIEEDADVILLLHRPEVHSPDGTDEPGVAYLHAAKNRDGRTGRVRVAFVGRYVRFDDLIEGY